MFYSIKIKMKNIILILMHITLLMPGYNLENMNANEGITFSPSKNIISAKQNNIPNPALSCQPIYGNGLSCSCVPIGTCLNLPNNGTGQIDIRIVNNPQVIPTQPSICPAQQVCCCNSLNPQCGIRYPPIPNSPSPMQGEAAFGAYPWQAAILIDGINYIGSGALISSNFVLTAAHKVMNRPPNTLTIRLGEWNAANINEPIPSQDFSVSQIIIHPNFQEDVLWNDIALIRLTMPARLGQIPTIGTVCLPASSFTGSLCYVAGWGKNSFIGGSYQTILREVDVQIRTSEDCQNLLSQTRLGPNYVFNNASFICAGGQIGKDACTGDGGAPLVCQMANRWFVTGLVAWGIGCANGQIPGVYVNVNNYVRWIQDTLAAYA